MPARYRQPFGLGVTATGSPAAGREAAVRWANPGRARHDGAVTEVSETSDDTSGLPTADELRAAAAAATGPWWRRIDKGLLAASMVVALGAVLMIRGLAVGITGDDRVPLPELIEEVDPVPEAVQVPNQTRVFVDLDTGYTGVLVIDDIEIETIDVQEIAGQQALEPGEQIALPPSTIFEGGNNTLTFVPNDSAPITEFVSGEHRAQVIYWEIEIGRQSAKSFSWTFTVV
jgi:hypothetical protein